MFIQCTNISTNNVDFMSGFNYSFPYVPSTLTRSEKMARCLPNSRADRNVDLTNCDISNRKCNRTKHLAVNRVMCSTHNRKHSCFINQTRYQDIYVPATYRL